MLGICWWPQNLALTFSQGHTETAVFLMRSGGITEPLGLLIVLCCNVGGLHDVTWLLELFALRPSSMSTHLTMSNGTCGVIVITHFTNVFHDIFIAPDSHISRHRRMPGLSCCHGWTSFAAQSLFGIKKQRFQSVYRYTIRWLLGLAIVGCLVVSKYANVSLCGHALGWHAVVVFSAKFEDRNPTNQRPGFQQCLNPVGAKFTLWIASSLWESCSRALQVVM